MKTLRIILSVALSVCVVLTFTIVKAQLSKPIYQDKTQEYKGILTIYHVETFEGGVGSRKQFLLKSARSFERENTGVLVMVSSHTKLSLESALDNGDYPDMISFGPGVNVKGVIEGQYKNTVSGGLIGKKSYATAWTKGGYVLIANPALVNEIPFELPSLLVSQNEYTQPLTALLYSKYSAKNIEIKKPMDAYVYFTSGKVPYFLGTQRDVSRLNNRGMDVVTSPLTEYNDLYQYIAITSTTQQKMVMAEKFINHLTNEGQQQKLTEINMFSPFYACKYSNEHLFQMQSIKENYTLSAFISDQELLKLQELSLKVIGGNQTEKNKIKNMVVKS